MGEITQFMDLLKQTRNYELVTSHNFSLLTIFGETIKFGTIVSGRLKSNKIHLSL